MRMSDMRRGLLGLLVLAGSLFGGPDLGRSAFAAPASAGTDDFARAETALREGQVESGLAALNAAAQRGGLRAGLRLAKIYAEGRIVARNEVKACELYGALADRHAQIDRTDPSARLVAEVFRLWAFCYLKGEPVLGWEPNVGKAADLFYQSGVMLDDPESLYELAKLYLKGDGVAPNPRMAVHHLFTATRKRHAPAQALLGALMWEGRVLKQQRVSGLALIKFALESAKPEERAWIDRQHEEAMITAKREEETDALRLIAEWKKAFGANPTGSTSPLIVATPPLQGTPVAQQPMVQTPTPQLPTAAQASPAPAPAPPPASPAVVPPAPVRAPNVGGQQLHSAPRHHLAAPGNAKQIQQNSFSTESTNANVPADQSPARE